MDQEYRMLGFVVIVILYAVIGLLAAKGSMCDAPSGFVRRNEQGVGAGSAFRSSRVTQAKLRLYLVAIRT